MSSGSIEVDGVDLSTVPLDTIRERCFVTIAQDPFFLPDASVRFNLDPGERLPDGAVASALEKVGLSFITDALSAASGDDDAVSGFDRPLSSLPALSVGQTQLLSFARALLQAQAAAEPRGASFSDYPGGARPKPVLLLDEVTSALDPATEAEVYDVVQREFADAGHTVVMVSHRLGAYAPRLRAGRDRVVWIRDGRVERIQAAEDLLDAGR